METEEEWLTRHFGEPGSEKRKAYEASMKEYDEMPYQEFGVILSESSAKEFEKVLPAYGGKIISNEEAFEFKSNVSNEKFRSIRYGIKEVRQLFYLGTYMGTVVERSKS